LLTNESDYREKFSMADTASTTTRTVTVPGIGAVPVNVTERGEGLPMLLLHGGAGPQSVDGFAALLASSRPARVFTPLHPGFGGTPRPDDLNSIRGLAKLYVQLIDDLGLTGVTVIGNSIGGWIAAEIALLNSPRISHVILVDAAGLRIDAHPAADFFSLTLDQVTDLSYFQPDKFRISLDAIPAPQKAIIAANRAALALYGGSPMDDPSLLGRMPAVAVPVLVVWGAADRIIPVEHGEAYAAAIPGAEFQVISDAGHLPQLETPDKLLQMVWDFATAPAGPPDVSVVGPDGGEVAFTGPTQMRILEDGRNTSHRLGMGEITVAPHTDGPPQHRHAQHDEGFYVVSGIARFTVGEKSYDAPAGSLVLIPPGAPHTFANPGGQPLVLLNTFTPDFYVQYFRDLHDLLAAGQPLSPGTMVNVMARYATEPATEYTS
jgi:pimeloyl-ACP methyl ester carboxylesterase/mannose-6-phosphate isomerase-like protein (cupin superfamily)